MIVLYCITVSDGEIRVEMHGNMTFGIKSSFGAADQSVIQATRRALPRLLRLAEFPVEIPGNCGRKSTAFPS